MIYETMDFRAQETAARMVADLQKAEARHIQEGEKLIYHLCTNDYEKKKENHVYILESRGKYLLNYNGKKVGEYNSRKAAAKGAYYREYITLADYTAFCQREDKKKIRILMMLNQD